MRLPLYLLFFPLLSNGQIENEIIESPAECGQKIASTNSSEVFTNSGEYPWVALVGFESFDEEKKFYGCTGSLINTQYVITTALCVTQERFDYKMSHVRLGEHDIKEDFDCHEQGNNPCVSRTLSVDFRIGEIVSHPSYNINGFQSHNIALIKLEEAVDFQLFDGFISPICLPPAEFDPKFILSDKLGEVVGWDFGSGHPNDVLMRERLLLADDRDCEVWFTGFERNREICMKSESIRRRCTGDSGSPLTAAGLDGVLLLGMLSYGPLPCGFSASPSVFTSISHYRDWIDSNMNIEEENA